MSGEMSAEKDNKGRIATIGTFDGLHAGHRALLRNLRDKAAELGMKPVVFAFANHPLDVIAPERRPERLQDASDQQRGLSRMGLDVVPVCFTPELMHMTRSEYMRMLRDKYDVRALVMGYDNRFGHDGNVPFEQYVDAGRELGIRVYRAGELPGVSSSIIRKMLRCGDVDKAADALGYLYNITGTVEHGRKLGSIIGFPTANIRLSDCTRLVPADGVYACFVRLNEDGAEHTYKAMTNIGHRPTIQDGRTYRSIEVHILGLNADLYGQTLQLCFVRRIREEIKFENIVQLRHQLELDRKYVVKILQKPINQYNGNN